MASAALDAMGSDSFPECGLGDSDGGHVLLLSFEPFTADAAKFLVCSTVSYVYFCSHSVALVMNCTGTSNVNGGPKSSVVVGFVELAFRAVWYIFLAYHRPTPLF